MASNNDEIQFSASAIVPMVREGFSRLLSDYLQSRVCETPELMVLADQISCEAMSLAQWVGLLDTMMEKLHDPDLPLHIGESLQIQHMGLAGQVFLSCATYGEATERVCEYLRLIGDMGIVSTCRNGQVGEVSYSGYGEAEPLPVLAQIFAAAVIRLTQWLTGRKDIEWEFHFQFQMPNDTSAYERIFGPRIRFRQTKTRAIFPAWVFDLPLPTQNSDMRPLAEAKAAASLRAMEEMGIVEQVSKLIAEELAMGSAVLDCVAQRLSISKRTLNRRLAESGTSFRAIYESVRQARAQQLLLETNMPLAGVSGALGFQEQSAFQHAFKRWTGITPYQFRNSRHVNHGKTQP